MARIVSLDFELASTLDLAEVGADVWTRHPDTVPILAGFALDYADPSVFRLDISFRPLEAELLRAVADGVEIHAWNANFEFQVWNNICAPLLGWPCLPIERFHCTMATAACAGLPMELSQAALAVGSPHLKDIQGHALMKRMARPRSVDPDGFIHWWHREDPIKLEQLADYCVADVEAERAVHLRIPRMSQREREIWLVDQKMNARGLPVDKELLTRLQEITLAEWLRLDAEITRLTNGAVTSCTQNLRLLEWIRARGYPYASLEKDTLTPFLNTPGFYALDDSVRVVLLARAERAKASAAKLNAMANYSQIDGVARNLVQYGGAVRTMRWAGRGPQIQNYPRPTIKHVDQAIESILGGMEPEGLRHIYGKPLDVVASCLRGVYKAPPGEKFVVADFHAIEAIVLAWLAEFEPLLDVFRRGEDVYTFTAQKIGSSSRQLGKVLVLACGYGMGPDKFQDTALGYGLELSYIEAKAAVMAYRKANKPIVDLWYACENSALNAIRNPGKGFRFKKLEFRMADPAKRLKGALLLKLPSERFLVYRNVRIDNGKIVFWGVNQYTRKWQELSTYGGKLVENATQAVARDLLADAIVALEQVFPGALRTTVHDEIVVMIETEKAFDYLAVIRQMMSWPPAWAKNIPLSAKGDISTRYGKL